MGGKLVISCLDRFPAQSPSGGKPMSVHVVGGASSMGKRTKMEERCFSSMVLDDYSAQLGVAVSKECRRRVRDGKGMAMR